MTNDSFKKMDERWMNDLKLMREKKVPAKMLDGFSASVEARIREVEKPQERKNFGFRPRRFFVPVFVPTFAVLIIASMVVLRSPSNPAQLASATTAVELSDEAAVLREVNVWTDEDEAAAGVSTDNSLADIELS